MSIINTTSNEIQINLAGVGATLNNLMFSVPIYQRAYSWEEKQVDDLLIDIETAINEDSNEYFLGSVVITKNGDRLDIVDGQQRIATVTMIISAIRDYFRENDDIPRASEIESRYLFSRDLYSLDLIPKVKLNLIDNDFFLRNILEQNKGVKNILTDKSSHEKISNASKKIKKKIKDITDKQDATENILKWVNFVNNKLKAIWVTAPDNANAFIIFETLNDRGLSLAIVDLLKNYFFGIAGKRINEVQNSWVSMIAILESASNNDEIGIDYIRHYWSANNGVVREKELYSKIKDSVKSETKVISFCKELENNAKIYCAIMNSEHEYWNGYSNTTKNYIDTINLLGVSQIRPLLIAIVNKFDNKELEKALKQIVAWTVRFLIHGGLGSGNLEQNYCETAKEIMKGNIKTTKGVFDNLKSIIPNDLVFKNSFQNASVSKSVLARYYLRILESELQGNDYYALDFDIPEKVNLEHIMPEKFVANWNSMNSDEHKAYYRRIGNLTLLKTKINSDAKSDEYSKKIEIYSKSDFKITKDITSKFTTWDKVSIEDRQKELAEIALKAWKLI